MINYYEVLGLNMDASANEIQERVIAEINKWRKRVNAPNPQKQREASEMMELMQEIQDTLLDENRRVAYDADLMEQERETNNAQQAQGAQEAQASDHDRHIDELYKRFDFHYDQQNYGDAIEVAKQLVRELPNNPYAWHKLAIANYSWDNFASARYEIEHAISLKENEAHHHYTASVIYHDSTDMNYQERLKRSIEFLNKALSIEPNNVLYRTESARYSFIQGYYQDSINLLENMVKEGTITENGEQILASSYVKKVQNECATQVNYSNGGHEFYFTSKDLIHTALQTLGHALNFAKDNETRNDVLHLHQLAEGSLKYTYNFKFLILIIIGAIWFLNALGDFSIIAMAISGGLTYLGWVKFRQTIYVKNKKFVDKLPTS